MFSSLLFSLSLSLSRKSFNIAVRLEAEFIFHVRRTLWS